MTTIKDRAATVEHTKLQISVKLVAAGLLLIQAAWILAVPPFRASDEFDHVYRAAAVARGDWRPEPTDATRGTGAFVTVPNDIVAAARPECVRLPYTDASDCVGTTEVGGTTIATGAGRYHPLFYAVIGTPALPLDGAAALYAMRVVGAVCCSVMLVLAFVALRLWTKTVWPSLALLTCCSPMVMFSSAMAAPNGLEMAAAAALWASLAGLLRAPTSEHRNRLLIIGTLAASLLVSLRSLGPLWALLILAALIASEPRRWSHLRLLLGTPAVWFASAVVAVTTGTSLAWIMTSDALVIGKVAESLDLTPGETWEAYWKSTISWIFQSIGAFPYRNAPAPVITYVCYLLLVVCLVGFAVRSASARDTWVIVATMALSLAIPLAITVRTFEAHGISWQGRYTIPFSMGFIFLSGLALERLGAHTTRMVLTLAVGLFTIAHAYSPAWLAAIERADSPGVNNGDWILLPPLVLGVLAAGGCLAAWAGVLGRFWERPSPREPSRG